MLKRVSLYILFVCLLPLFGVAQKFNWANNFSNSSNKSTSSLANTNTGSSFVGGYFDGVLTVSGTNMTAKGGKDNFVTVYAKMEFYYGMGLFITNQMVQTMTLTVLISIADPVLLLLVVN